MFDVVLFSFVMMILVVIIGGVVAPVAINLFFVLLQDGLVGSVLANPAIGP